MKGKFVPGTAVSTAPMKQYEVSQKKKNFEIRQNGGTIMYTNKTKQGLSLPQIDIHEKEQTVLASVKLEKGNGAALLHLGNPEDTNDADWTSLEAMNSNAYQYKFVVGSRTYVWTKTQSKDSGAVRVPGRDYKLSEEGSGQVVMMEYRYNQAMFKKGVFATVDFHMDVGQDVELLALAAILGIQESIAIRQYSSSLNFFTAAMTMNALGGAGSA